MLLVGMLDSPYVRRVAISLQLLGLPFTHRSLSVFRTFDAFREINPVVKAPTLVCNDGIVLMDSTLILDYAEALAAPRRSLMPADTAGRRNALRRIGLALAACEKAVQLIYERTLRPEDKRHVPWIERVTGQLRAACGELEAELRKRPENASAQSIGQAGITIAVTWHFMQQTVSQLVREADHPALALLSAHAEQLPAFVAAPHGAGTFR